MKRHHSYLLSLSLVIGACSLGACSSGPEDTHTGGSGGTGVTGGTTTGGTTTGGTGGITTGGTGGDCADADSDGHPAASCGGDDCDDTKEAIHPGATDTCTDGIDQDCSGGDLPCPQCADGPASDVRCTCGGELLAGGYCCANVAQPDACAPFTDIPPSRRTTWSPGVSGGVPDTSQYTVCATVSLGANASTNTAHINDAVVAAGAMATAQEPCVVQLPAGSWHVNGMIFLDQNHVVLKGAGPDPNGNGTGTRLVDDEVDGDMFQFGPYTDFWGTAVSLTAPADKGASSFTLQAGHGVEVGDLLVIDRLDDADVELEGGFWWKRAPDNSDNGPLSPGGYRSLGQTVEVTGVNGNVITIAGILHNAFPVAGYASQVFGSTINRSGGAGIGLEDMTITGWGDAMGVHATFVKDSWVKDVEFDGRPMSQGASYGPGTGHGPGTQGNDIRVFRSVRFTIEHSYLHHSRVYITNNEAYSISIAEQTSDTLVQDNIVWFKNKNVVLEASGGGNVIAYNYLEDPVIADGGADVRTDWMEMCLDGSHLSYPSMDLFEGNYTAKMGAAETHGNAGDQTFFRNYSKGDRLHTMEPNPGMAAVMLNRYMRRMNFVGNMLSTRAGGIYAPTFDADGNMPWDEVGQAKIWSIGLDGWNGEWQGPQDPDVESQLLRIANYDTIRNQVDQVPGSPLAASLYLGSKPAFFGAYDWPWVNPLGATPADRLKTLPAQARFASGTFF